MIYLDNAATAKLKKTALDAMLQAYDLNFANPSALYLAAGKARRAMEQARDTFAEELNCDRDEIFFTSGGTESDNWSVFGTAEALRNKGKHIITQKTEHHAILNSLKALERKGYEVTYLNVDENGVLDPETLEKAIRRDTILVSVMAANNETGVLQKLEEIGRITHKHRITFHTDAVQAFGHIPLDVKALNIDLLSASAHKIGGPRGTGLLYKRLDTELVPLIYGGGQERELRSGTENVAGIVGFAAALKDKDDSGYVRSLRDHMAGRLTSEIEDVTVNGNVKDRLPGILNISIRGVKGESVLMRLSSLGICASTGSACTSRSGEPSHVLTAMGLDAKTCDSSLRFSLSGENTKAEIDETVDALKEIVGDFRKMMY